MKDFGKYLGITLPDAILIDWKLVIIVNLLFIHWVIHSIRKTMTCQTHAFVFGMFGLSGVLLKWVYLRV